MNRFELICTYCGNSWEINYTPQEIIYCGKCQDSGIRVKNIASERIDYYAGSPPFEEDDAFEPWNS